MEGYDASAHQQEGERQDKQAMTQGEIDNLADHYLSLTGVWAARPQDSQGLEQYSTVEKLFAVIQRRTGKAALPR